MYPQILQRSKLLFRVVILMAVNQLFAFSLAGQTCTSLAIPENGCGSGMNLLVPITISGAPGSNLGTDVFLDKVDLIIDHHMASNLDIFLRSPSGFEIELSTDNGFTYDYGNPTTCPNNPTTFADWATTSITAGSSPFIGVYLPETSFSAFNGSNPNGVWTLRICDDSPISVGNFIYGNLSFTTCMRPSALVSNTPTVNGATLNWTAIGSATAWDIEFQPTGTAQTGTPTVSGITSKPYTWTGGAPGTIYQAWIRSNCGGSVSEWIGPTTFTTKLDNNVQTCTSFPIPDNGCDAGNNLQAPVVVSGAPGSSLGTDVFIDRVELIIQHVVDMQLSIYLQSPGGAEILLSSDNGALGDHYGNPANCPNQVTAFASWASGSITAGTAPFIGTYLPEGSFSAFNGVNPNGEWLLKVCDGSSFNSGSLKYVKIFFTTCARPTGLLASVPTGVGATMNWTENGNATSWDLEFQPVGTPATGTPTVTGISTKPYVWTGGAPYTNYQAWVRSNCGGSVSGWTGPVTFTTILNNAAPVCFTTTIPDPGCLPVQVAVSGAPGSILGTDVFLDKVEVIVQHTRDSDVDIYLKSPNGVEIDVSSDNGGTGDHYGNPTTCPVQVTSFATWASSSITTGAAPFIGIYRPETPFSSFDGSNPNGTWALTACDGVNGTTGSLRYVKLYFTTSLPVALTTFIATPVEEKSVRLQWTTATERNSARFDLERSADGQHFYTIANVPAAGNSSDEHQYEWMDTNPLRAENYYRLRQVDFDGAFEYSPVRVAVMPDKNLNWPVYPNPAQTAFFVENGEEEGRLSLFDVAGNMVLEQALSTGGTGTEIKTEGLPSGLYGIKIQTERGVFSSKVVVERE
ncbi:MAG TPA: proprotein convertase P-domain-containing protein [Saprospiraceae bacterium]|nr:proprotein convertase P-domain-containing protein [Saprospiraceae bacterium]